MTSSHKLWMLRCRMTSLPELNKTPNCPSSTNHKPIFLFHNYHSLFHSIQATHKYKMFRMQTFTLKYLGFWVFGESKWLFTCSHFKLFSFQACTQRSTLSHAAHSIRVKRSWTGITCRARTTNMSEQFYTCSGCSFIRVRPLCILPLTGQSYL